MALLTQWLVFLYCPIELVLKKVVHKPRIESGSAGLKPNALDPLNYSLSLVLSSSPNNVVSPAVNSVFH